MKKLILFALAAAGIGVLVKNKSEQLKAGANKVSNDPRFQSALATASEKAAPLKEKAAPYASTVKEKAGPYAATVKEKAGPYADQAREKAAAAAGAASDKLHRDDSTTGSTTGSDTGFGAGATTPASSNSTTEEVFDAESPATPEPGAATGSSSTSEYGGYPPASSSAPSSAQPTSAPASPAPVTGDPLTDPIDPYAEEVPSSSTGDAPAADEAPFVEEAPTSENDQTTYDDLGEGDTVVKPTSESAPEFAPEPVDSTKSDPAKDGTDTQWFRG
ncbi:hypothetical protein FB381_3851 [Nocardioides albertanoniae]|uniref:Uncharacterized protein n=1 Tax=Nocardioides albertanoniae TaxID=1175486 RepID=A0A543ABE5_9ACTN|nr:hypothetical protein [Nocardioides albertanoniae]TQL69928.1 hypothetical protein FB381_3851 [Nocardioides albertanoniae]